MQTEATPEPVITRYRITVEEYDLMCEAGVFKPEERLELINREILKVAPTNAPHMSHVIRLSSIFTERLNRRAIISTQLSKDLEPEPDIAILQGRSDDYFSGKPSCTIFMP